MTADARRKILWGAGLPASPLPDRIEAAAINGYTDLSISGGDQVWAINQGIAPEELRQRATDGGVALSSLDGVVEWYPHVPPKRPLGTPIPLDETLAAAEAFGAKTINAIAPYPTEVPIEGLAEHFASVCDRAVNHGLLVHFEFTPKSPIDDVFKAFKLVELAGRDNGGILFDTWHFCRVNPDIEGLKKQIPGDRIFAVQVSDGNQEFVEGLLPDTFRHRFLPGTGSFPLVEILRTLDEMGGLTLAGPEVLAVEQFALEVAEAARQQGEAYDRVLAEAGLA
jgi:sugar phosphate isomerase/epimerase